MTSLAMSFDSSNLHNAAPSSQVQLDLKEPLWGSERISVKTMDGFLKALPERQSLRNPRSRFHPTQLHLPTRVRPFDVEAFGWVAVSSSFPNECPLSPQMAILFMVTVHIDFLAPSNFVEASFTESFTSHQSFDLLLSDADSKFDVVPISSLVVIGHLVSLDSHFGMHARS
jgi:hypothetical protein